ncbi:uncharacterized protein STEHIDRAFT_118082 [Stereum hirsutum FP-91666 SS1]|uniref:uncharacterized protein n=1 Tax=Stereum hirsutum (strain FP-91666) TaxID=721885 RepID=UPI000440D349|nr:uncharacterized protein STEHIDRAFT_118082 [Stereum hirsutum FP-91666 SS1]EIM90847.1 hypothetical protein STEHIDRAFT_118082 [Stereum hirsutum FP-91666 SS1]
MSAIRAASKHSRTISASLRGTSSQTRTFFSPFPAANKSPLAASSSASPATQADQPSTVYVVSQPDASERPYSVPAGAYPVSAPFSN